MPDPITAIAVGWGCTLVALVCQAVSRERRRRVVVRRLKESAY